MSTPRIREAVRALVLDEDANVLLVNFNWPDPGLADGFLACPGGGVALGGFRMSGWEGQWDTWYLVRVRALHAGAPRRPRRGGRPRGALLLACRVAHRVNKG